jgi:hypothetical protein
MSSEDGRIQVVANVDAKIPHWVPIYPGAKLSSQTAKENGGTMMLEVKEEFGKVKAWSEEQIKAQWFDWKLATLPEGSQVLLIASKNDEKQGLAIIIRKRSRSLLGRQLRLDRESRALARARASA